MKLSWIAKTARYIQMGNRRWSTRKESMTPRKDDVAYLGMKSCKTEAIHVGITRTFGLFGCPRH